MAAGKLSTQDKKDLDKFTKYLALKSIQIIVQSRLGEKVSTSSKPLTSGADWFSLAVNDIASINNEAKKTFQEDSVIPRLPLCVEISLKTVDNDTMILENWILGMLPDQYDPSQKVTCTVYNRMTILLKSLLSVTRVTPAYKLSRRQGPDSYIIFYKVFFGEPQMHLLGDGFRKVRVGQLCTPLGTLYMSVAYRTKMTITPVQAQQDTSIMVKSDHFHSDVSPKHNRNKQNEKKTVNLDEPMRAGAFVDVSKIKAFTESDFILPENPPLSWLLDDIPKVEKDSTKPELDDYIPCCEGHSMNGKGSPQTNGIELNERKPSIWTVGPEDDKLMKELHFPFATADKSPIGELATFYRECYNAPPLQTFIDKGIGESEVASELEDPTADITQQLAMFETSMQEYDSMVTSLAHSPNNN